jgi:hypothetical protein
MIGGPLECGLKPKWGNFAIHREPLYFHIYGRVDFTYLIPA